MSKNYTILNDSDIRYGIIKISKLRDVIGENTCGSITIECGGDSVTANIPHHKGYISRLGKLHNANNAQDGTKVTIKNLGNRRYELSYSNGETSRQDDDDRLESVIESAKYKILDNTWQFNDNEANVRAEIVDPILNALGWTFPNCAYREASCQLSNYKNKSNGSVDYALHNGEKFSFIIETKAVNNELSPICKGYGDVVSNISLLKTVLQDIAEKPSPDGSDLYYSKRNPFIQLARYMKSERFVGAFGILTNGYSWYFINQTLDKVWSITIDNPRFIDYIKVFDFSGSNSLCFDDTNVEFESLIHHREHFKIDDNFEIVPDTFSSKDPTNVYKDFIAGTYCGVCIPNKVLEMQEKGLFAKPVISSKKHANMSKYPGKQLYIDCYSNTFEKRMIIQQILDYIKSL